MFKGAAAGLFALSLAACAQAATHVYNWDVTWVWASPDGFGRPVIGINNAWPLPTVRASVNDVITVHLTNQLGNQTTGIHWHGINQVSTSWMDGAEMVTQCPVPPGSTFTYSFVVDAPGTYWYHSHNLGQYPDGLRGILIVDDPNDPYKGQYDEEHVITLSDWYHTQSITLVQNLLQASNPHGIPPFPDAALVNDGQSADYHFDPTKTYRFRIISFSAFASFMIALDSHKLTVIMNDATYISPVDVDQLRITPAQRYDILVKGQPTDNRNYGFLFSLDENPDFSTGGSNLVWPINSTAYLISNPSAPKPAFEVDAWVPADDSKWHCKDHQTVLPNPDQTFDMDFDLCLDSAGIPRMCINGQPYVEAKVPTLYTASSVGTANENPIVYGDVNPFVANQGGVVEIVLNNLGDGVHPFHLHGHQFQVLARPASGTGKYPGSGVTFNPNPPRRDTVSVMGNSYLVLRFEATNPGVYLFHCHIEWHVVMGLSSTIIEAPEFLRNLPIPKDHIAVCRKGGKATKGNAGGNVKHPLDTSNYNTAPANPYIGATWVPPPNTCKAKQRRRNTIEA